MANVVLSFRRNGPELLALRMALAAKGIKVDLKQKELPEHVPVILSEPFRGVNCPDTRSGLEYIEERFPEPPLMPIDPASRMRVRAVINRIMATFDKSIGDPAVKEVAEAIEQLLRMTDKPWLVGDQMTLADCAAVAFLHCKVPQGLFRSCPKAKSYMLRFEQHEESAKRVGLGFFETN